jgi:hypothetical protein
VNEHPLNTAAFSKETLEKLAQVDFGLECQAFLKSKIGVYLVERAQGEVEEKTQLLKRFDVLADPIGAKNLQMEIAVAENFLYWMAEAVTTGTDLMQQLVAEERLGRGDSDAST